MADSMPTIVDMTEIDRFDPNKPVKDQVPRSVLTISKEVLNGDIPGTLGLFWYSINPDISGLQESLEKAEGTDDTVMKGVFGLLYKDVVVFGKPKDIETLKEIASLSGSMVSPEECLRIIEKSSPISKSCLYRYKVVVQTNEASISTEGSSSKSGEVIDELRRVLSEAISIYRLKTAYPDAEIKRMS